MDFWPRDVAETTQRKNRSEISGEALVPIVSHSKTTYEVMLEKADLTLLRSSISRASGTPQKDVYKTPGESPTLAFQIETGGMPSLHVVGSPEQPLVHKPRPVSAWTGKPSDFELGKWHTVVIEAKTNPCGHRGKYAPCTSSMASGVKLTALRIRTPARLAM